MKKRMCAWPDRPLLARRAPRAERAARRACARSPSGRTAAPLQPPFGASPARPCGKFRRLSILGAMRDSPEALQALTEAVGKALRADAAVVRLREEASGDLAARSRLGASAVALRRARRISRPTGRRATGRLRALPSRSSAETRSSASSSCASGEPFAENDVSLAESAAAQAASSSPPSWAWASTVRRLAGSASWRWRERRSRWLRAAVPASSSSSRRRRAGPRERCCGAQRWWRAQLAAEVTVDQTQLPGARAGRGGHAREQGSGRGRKVSRERPARRAAARCPPARLRERGRAAERKSAARSRPSECALPRRCARTRPWSRRRRSWSARGRS